MREAALGLQKLALRWGRQFGAQGPQRPCQRNRDLGAVTTRPFPASVVAEVQVQAHEAVEAFRFLNLYADRIPPLANGWIFFFFLQKKYIFLIKKKRRKYREKPETVVGMGWIII